MRVVLPQPYSVADAELLQNTAFDGAMRHMGGFALLRVILRRCNIDGSDQTVELFERRQFHWVKSFFGSPQSARGSSRLSIVG